MDTATETAGRVTSWNKGALLSQKPSFPKSRSP